MSVRKIAVVGGGIAGLSSAYYLSKTGRFEVSLFEADAALGGHAHTYNHQGLPLDTTVVGFHKDAYPKFTALVRELGLFDQTSVFRQDLCFHSTRGIDYLITYNPLSALRHPRTLWRTTRALRKFSRAIVAHRNDPSMDRLSLGEFLTFVRMSADEIRFLVLPMIHMFVAMDFDQILEMPARFMIEHLYEHKVLHHSSANSWRAWNNGTQTYVNKLAEKIRGPVYRNAAVSSVQRRSDGRVRLTSSVRSAEDFDAVILATPPSVSLRMLESPNDREQKLLGPWRERKLKMCLHDDTSLLAKNPRDRGFWNPFVDDRSGLCGASYLLHKIQPRAPQNLMVSWEAIQPIDPQRIIYSREVLIPQYSKNAMTTHKDLPLLNQQSRGVFYAGAYLSQGWHESGVTSALAVVDKILQS